jgi:hypothetical protein
MAEAKSVVQIMRESIIVLRAVLGCQAPGGAKCAPNDEDLDACSQHLSDIYEWFKLNDIQP